eukprot:770433-Ditylum_brightwellii.AAC.1
MYSDANLDRELRERRFTTSIALLTNDVATHWDVSMKGDTTGVTTSAGLFTLHKGDPSTVYEDNADTIKAITSDCTSPTHRHHDVKISTVIYYKQKGC